LHGAEQHDQTKTKVAETTKFHEKPPPKDALTPAYLYDNNSNPTSEIVRNSAKSPDWLGITRFYYLRNPRRYYNV
jgi:hypothetical protein